MSDRVITHVYFGPVNGNRGFHRLKISSLLGIDPSALRLSNCPIEEAAVRAAAETKLVGLCHIDVERMMGGQPQ